MKETSPNTNTSMVMNETDDTNKQSSVVVANQDANTLLEESSGTDLGTKTTTDMKQREH